MKGLNVGIFGIGAIGTVISFSLNDAINPLYFNRSAKSTIQLNYQNTLSQRDIQLSGSLDAIELDWLIICLKEYQYVKAYQQLGNLISPNTKIAVIRNGINLKDRILKFASASRILECMIDAPTQLAKTVGYELLSFPEIIVEKSELASEFSQLFNSKLIHIKTTENYVYENWKKLIESSSLGAIMCIANTRSIIFKKEKYLEMYKQLILEGINVATAAGVRVETNLLNLILKKLLTYGDHKASSMLTDKIAGREIEINAKNGAIVHVADQLNVAVPVNKQMVCLLKEMNKEGSV